METHKRPTAASQRREESPDWASAGSSASGSPGAGTGASDSDEDLGSFLAGLKQRYNVDAGGGDSHQTTTVTVTGHMYTTDSSIAAVTASTPATSSSYGPSALYDLLGATPTPMGPQQQQQQQQQQASEQSPTFCDTAPEAVQLDTSTSPQSPPAPSQHLYSRIDMSPASNMASPAQGTLSGSTQPSSPYSGYAASHGQASASFLDHSSVLTASITTTPTTTPSGAQLASPGVASHGGQQQQLHHRTLDASSPASRPPVNRRLLELEATPVAAASSSSSGGRGRRSTPASPAATATPMPVDTSAGSPSQRLTSQIGASDTAIAQPSSAKPFEPQSPPAMAVAPAGSGYSAESSPAALPMPHRGEAAGKAALPFSPGGSLFAQLLASPAATAPGRTPQQWQQQSPQLQQTSVRASMQGSARVSGEQIEAEAAAAALASDEATASAVLHAQHSTEAAGADAVASDGAAAVVLQTAVDAAPLAADALDAEDAQAAAGASQPAADASTSGPAGAADSSWQALNDLLSANGFAVLPMWSHRAGRANAFGPSSSNSSSSGGQQQQQQQQAPAPTLESLRASLASVVRQFARRSALVGQLLAQQEESRKEQQRAAQEMDRLLRERDNAVRAAARAKADLTDFSSKQLGRLEAKHKEAEAKLASEASKLRFALKEAEAAAAAARQMAPGAAEQAEAAALGAELAAAAKARDRNKDECDKATAELSRLKAYVRDVERAAAAARTSARSAEAEAQRALKDVEAEKQRHGQETVALAAQVQQARQRIREVEQEAVSLRTESQAAAEAADLMRQMDRMQEEHEEETQHLASELQKLRQQVQELQQAVARTEAAHRSEATAAAYAAKQLARADAAAMEQMAKATTEIQRLREAVRQLDEAATAKDHQISLQEIELQRLELLLQSDSSRAEQAGQELAHLRDMAKAVAQRYSGEVSGLRERVAALEQQLTSSIEQLRRLRAAGLDEAGTGTGNVGVGGDSGRGRSGGRPWAGEGPAQVILAPQQSPSASGSQAHTSPSGSAPTGAASPAATASEHAEASAADDATTAPAASTQPPASTRTLPAAVAAATSARQSHSTSTGPDADLSAAIARATRAEEAHRAADSERMRQQHVVSSLQHALRGREMEMEKLRERLADKVAKEERRLARDKAAYARLRQAHAAARRDPSGRGAAGAVTVAARELRAPEIVGVYESQREAMETELHVLRSECKALGLALRNAQNAIMAKDKASAAAARTKSLFGPSSAADENSIRGPSTSTAATAAAEQKLAQLQAELCATRADAAEALRLAHRRLGEAEAAAARLRADADDLASELEMRPTVQENRALKREIDMLERTLARLRITAAAQSALDDPFADPGTTAEEGEEALKLAALSSAIAGRGTKARVERDRALARLGLGAIGAFPRDVLVYLVQDACISLDLSDATLLAPTLHKLLRVLDALPRLEAFVAQVCTICFSRGLAFVPAHLAADIGPGTVPPVLEAWLERLQEGEHMRAALAATAAALSHRTVAASTGMHMQQHAAESQPEVPSQAAAAASGGGQLLALTQLSDLPAAVEQLVSIEAQHQATRQALGGAEALLATSPQGVLQVLLAHVQRLFEVPSLEGLIPAMNKVYVSYSELGNFFRALGSLLALPGDAGPGAAMARVRQLVLASGRDLRREQELSQAMDNVTAHAAGKHGQAAGATTAAAAGHAGAAWSNVPDENAEEGPSPMEVLLKKLGVQSSEQAVAERAAARERLQRLDTLLPKYQRVASKLYEMLRVTSLDDVVPAVQQLAGRG